MTVELKYRLQFSTFQSGVRFWRRAGSVCACVLRLACKPPNISEATHITVVLANSCSTEPTGKRRRAKLRAGGSPASQLVGWTTSCPHTNTYFQNKNFTLATYIHFPRILNDGKIGIQINPTARGFRHLVLPQHQAGGCLQKGWPQNVTEIPV